MHPRHNLELQYYIIWIPEGWGSISVGANNLIFLSFERIFISDWLFTTNKNLSNFNPQSTLISEM